MTGGWRHLKQALNRGDNLDVLTLMDVIRFYDDVLEKYPDHFELLFPLGTLNKEFVDANRAKENLLFFREKLTADQRCPPAEQQSFLDIAKQQFDELA